VAMPLEGIGVSIYLSIIYLSDQVTARCHCSFSGSLKPDVLNPILVINFHLKKTLYYVQPIDVKGCEIVLKGRESDSFIVGHGVAISLSTSTTLS
jgi:hypothetical protein